MPTPNFIQVLQSYFDRVYPGSSIETEDSFEGTVHIRFELGGSKENGTIERVNQATERALTIFNDVFNDPAHEIFVLIHEYAGNNGFQADNAYLHHQFTPPKIGQSPQWEQLNSRMNKSDQANPGVSKEAEVKILAGKFPVKNINVRNILTGIANTEMGFDPGIDQRVFFFDPLTDKAFHMYDDRGCIVWSNHADKIRDIFLTRNDWIVAYHRANIEAFFQ